MTDDELVRAAMSGQQAAQCELARRSHRRVFALCCSRVTRWHDAEELTQEVLVRAMTSVSGLNAPEHYHAWLRGIANHVCADWHRKHLHRQGVVELIREDLEPADCGTPEQEASENEEQSHLQREVDKLPAELREVLILHYFDNLTYDELAAWLGVARATVSERLSRARTQLRARLTQVERNLR